MKSKGKENDKEIERQQKLNETGNENAVKIK